MGKDFTSVDRVTLAAFIVLIGLAVYAYVVLPASIPTSFGWSGRPQAFSPKFMVFMEPAIAAFACLLVALVKPNMGKVPFAIPPDRLPLVEAHYVAVSHLFLAEIVCGMLAIEWAMLESARALWLAPAFLPVIGAIIITILGTTIVNYVQIWRIARG